MLIRILAALLLPIAAQAGPPLRLLGSARMLPLIQAVQADQGLLKHLYSFSLPGGPMQFVGLTGNISFTAAQDHFGEALISVTYLNAGDCAAVNNTVFRSYSDPGFPALTHLAAFVLKTTHAGTVTLPVNVGFATGVPVSSCLVLVLDGGGAWGPGHAQPMLVTITSFLTFLYTPLPSPRPPAASAYPLGAEVSLRAGSPATEAVVLRANPALPGAIAISSIFGSIAASPFDGTSGEPVPTGKWATRGTMSVYPSPVCTSAFAPASVFSGPVHAQLVSLPVSVTPPGGRMLIAQAPGGNGDAGLQLPFSQSYGGLLLHPGDCLVSLLGPLGTLNGTIDLEQQATAVIEPMP